MPLDVITEDDGAGVLVTLTGEVPTHEIIEFKKRLYWQKDRKRLSYQIWYLPEGSPGQRSDDELRQVAAIDAEGLKEHPGMLIALVLGTHPLRNETRMYQLYSSIWAKDMKLKTFTVIEKARGWIASERAEVRRAQINLPLKK